MSHGVQPNGTGEQHRPHPSRHTVGMMILQEPLTAWAEKPVEEGTEEERLTEWQTAFIDSVASVIEDVLAAYPEGEDIKRDIAKRLGEISG